MPANFTEVFVVPFLQSTSSAGHSLTCCVCTSLTPNLWTATPNCLRVSVESLAVHHPVDSLLSIRYLKKRSFLSISSMNYSLFFFFQTHLDFLLYLFEFMTQSGYFVPLENDTWWTLINWLRRLRCSSDKIGWKN